MRHSPMATLAIAITLVSAACQPVDQAPSELTAADAEAIRAVDAAATEAGVAGDFDAFAALYTEDAILLPPNAPAVTGRSAIRDYWASVPPIVAFEIEVEEIVGRGDLAYVQGSYLLELAPPGAPEPIRDNGKFIEIRRRQPDGSWPLSRDIYNSNLPIAAPEPADATASEGET
ncbi:MAG: DUF4440 domain-containing protein [Gemmatimonadota bacterium]